MLVGMVASFLAEHLEKFAERILKLTKWVGL